jgi:hypothetical protein
MEGVGVSLELAFERRRLGLGLYILIEGMRVALRFSSDCRHFDFNSKSSNSKPGPGLSTLTEVRRASLGGMSAEAVHQHPTNLDSEIVIPPLIG